MQSSTLFAFFTPLLIIDIIFQYQVIFSLHFEYTPAPGSEGKRLLKIRICLLKQILACKTLTPFHVKVHSTLKKPQRTKKPSLQPRYASSLQSFIGFNLNLFKKLKVGSKPTLKSLMVIEDLKRICSPVENCNQPAEPVVPRLSYKREQKPLI